ncbi:hypothetical protein [Ornithinicoccus halotolerans]|uniref:hypothetical protein n=1 Tax=Ornithinicoccus halotolerans TaxID=1748220 RepID=UPI0012975FB0|nr:hypothetical protein [Ornithinicoccus halotolerans]
MAGGQRNPTRARIRVHPPVVRESRVDFSWEQDIENHYQRRNRWYVDYHGVPLATMDRRVLYEVLLSLQLPMWAVQARQVVVELPEPVPALTREFWPAYHGLQRLRVESPEGAPARVTLRRTGRRDRTVAVSFGGGKDSTLAHRALLERRPSREVLLLHLVQLFAGDRTTRERATRRSRRTVLRPVRLQTRSPIQLVTTDYMAALRRDRYGPRPHVNLYVPAMLPALVHHGVHQVVFSRTAMGYQVRYRDDGTASYRNWLGRPEQLRYLDAYLAHVLGWPLHAESTHRGINEYVSFGTVLRQYPRASRRMVMCTRTLDTRRFCLECSKCLEFALMGLSLGHVAPDLDYDALLTHPRVTALAEQARALGGRTAWHGAGPYQEQTGTGTHFATWCHALHLLEPARLDGRVGAGAAANLRALKDAWGQVPFPAVERLDSRAVAAAGPLGREVAGVAGRHFPVVDMAGDAREHLQLDGDEAVPLDHEAVMPTPWLDAWARRWGVAVDGTEPVSGVT